MDMVEKVARAIYEAAYDGNWDRIPNDDWYKKPCFDQARAAIAAMREPTRRMVKAAAKSMSPDRRPTPERVSCNVKHAIRYQAMIDAALTSEGPACQTCQDDPVVCASIPMRHCEKTTSTAPATPSSE